MHSGTDKSKRSKEIKIKQGRIQYIKTVKLKKFQLTGHLFHREKQGMPLKILKNKLGDRELIGKLNNGWQNAVERDTKQFLGAYYNGRPRLDIDL